MRHISIVALTFICVYGHAQQDVIEPLHLTNTELSSKLASRAKTQKTLGIVMATAGPVLFLVGEAIYLKDYGINFTFLGSRSSDDLEIEMTSAALMIAGAVLVAGSVPLFLAANKNNKRAKLLLGGQPLSLFPKARPTPLPGVSVVFQF